MRRMGSFFNFDVKIQLNVPLSWESIQLVCIYEKECEINSVKTWAERCWYNYIQYWLNWDMYATRKVFTFGLNNSRMAMDETVSSRPESIPGQRVIIQYLFQTKKIEISYQNAFTDVASLTLFVSCTSNFLADS